VASISTKKKGRKNAYIVRWHDHDTGKHRSRTVTSYELARQIRKAGADIEERSRISADLGPREHENVSLSWAIEQWYEQKTPTWSPATQRLRRSVINGIPARLKGTAVRQVTAGAVEAVLDAKAASAQSMVVWTRLVIASALKWAVKHGYVRHSIMSLVDTPVSARGRNTAVDVKLLLSLDEVRKIVDEITPRHRTFVLVMANSGLRPGEAAALKVDDIDLDDGHIIVDKGSGEGGRTKTETSVRTVVISDEAVRLLARHIEEQLLQPGDPLFSNVRGDTFKYATFRERHWTPTLEAHVFEDVRKQRYRRANGKSRYTPNSLRHTHASVLLQAGVNPAVVASQLGHKHAGITLAVYSGYFTQDEGAVRAALNAGAAATPDPEIPRIHGNPTGVSVADQNR